MRYWWVNQNQTYRAEVAGGYLWSPKRNKNGARNQFYENMREVAPGDLVFSYRDAQIVALGTAASFCRDAPKPAEFGVSGANWDDAGWKVHVAYMELPHALRPKDHLGRIRPLLPAKYSPLQETGDGLQSVYLASLPQDLGELLLELLRAAGNSVSVQPVAPAAPDSQHERDVGEYEDRLETSIRAGSQLPATEREQLVKARRGQGLFRERLQRVERGCRITGIADPEYLVASHIKPWRVADNAERLDGENGLLLTPNLDRLFDRGFISFEDDGTLLLSPIANKSCLRKLGVPVDEPSHVGAFTPKQQEYLSFHRRNVFLETGRER
jgi:hypothetical protein